MCSLGISLFVISSPGKFSVFHIVIVLSLCYYYVLHVAIFPEFYSSFLTNFLLPDSLFTIFSILVNSFPDIFPVSITLSQRLVLNILCCYYISTLVHLLSAFATKWIVENFVDYDIYYFSWFCELTGARLSRMTLLHLVQWQLCAYHHQEVMPGSSTWYKVTVYRRTYTTICIYYNRCDLLQSFSLQFIWSSLFKYWGELASLVAKLIVSTNFWFSNYDT